MHMVIFQYILDPQALAEIEKDGVQQPNLAVVLYQPGDIAVIVCIQY